MAGEHMARSLKAILALGTVGYSRLMAADEEGTHARLKAHREELLDPAIAKYQGNVIKNTGDGLLVEFPSAVDCVACAVEIQRRMARRNQDVVPDRRLDLRIGINVGDVMKDGGDIYGTGVNVAVRLEGLAEPGGILISEDAYRQIHGKLEIELRDRGPQHLKNIDEPVRAYAVRLEPADTIPSDAPATKSPPTWRVGVAAMVIAGLVGALGWQSVREPRVEAAQVENMAFPLPDKPSIAVLPFVDLSVEGNGEALADGISEDILTALSKLAELFVISRTTTFSYKGKDLTVKQVAEDLGVRYVLEGSVQRDGVRMRVTAQLIDALSGQHVWAERYDRDVSDLFSVKDEITLSIVANIGAEIVKEANALAREHLEQAIAIDPDFAAAYVWLGTAHRDLGLRGWSDNFDNEVEKAFRFYGLALDINPDHPIALAHLAFLQNSLGDVNLVLETAMKAVVFDPNDYNVRGVYGRVLLFDGQYEAGIREIELSARLSPVSPDWVPIFLGEAHYVAGDSQLARKTLEDLLAVGEHSDFNEAWARTMLALALESLGDEEKARTEIEKAQEALAAWTISASAIWIHYLVRFGSIIRTLPYKDPAIFEGWAETWRRLGLPE